MGEVHLHPSINLTKPGTVNLKRSGKVKLTHPATLTNPATTQGDGVVNALTGVPHLQENAPPWDPTVGPCLGS